MNNYQNEDGSYKYKAKRRPAFVIDYSPVYLRSFIAKGLPDVL